MGVSRWLGFMAACGSNWFGGAAACDLVMDEALRPIVLTYEPFSVGGQTGQSEIAFRDLSEAGGEPQRYDLVFQPQTLAADFALSAELIGRSGTLTRVDDDRYRFEVGPGGQATIGFTATVTAAGVPSAGEAALTFLVNVFEAGTGLPCLEDAVLPVEITVPSRAQVNIAGAAGRFTDGPGLYTLDFGSLVTGAVRRAAVQLRANGEAELSIRSENGGRLRHESLAAFVPYAATLDGSVLDLSAETVRPAPPARSAAGVSLPMEVTIGEVSDAPSGRFADTITLTISAY